MWYQMILVSQSSHITKLYENNMLYVHKGSQVGKVGICSWSHSGSSPILYLHLQEHMCPSQPQPGSVHIISAHISLDRISHKAQYNYKKAWKFRGTNGRGEHYCPCHYNLFPKLYKTDPGEEVLSLPQFSKPYQGTEFPLSSCFWVFTEKERRMSSHHVANTLWDGYSESANSASLYPLYNVDCLEKLTHLSRFCCS